MKKLNHTHHSGCYADIKVLTTYNEITRQFGEPTVIGSGDDKVQYTWDFKTENGVHFYMYDWKEYDGFGNDENIWWHIGRVFGKNAWKPGDYKNVVNELKEHFATVKEDRL